MALTEAANDGTFNDTTAVTLVAAPSSGQRHVVRSIMVINRDSADVTVTVRYINGANTRELVVIALAPNDALVIDDVIVLDTTSKSLTGVLSSAAASTQPDFVANYGVVS